MLNSQKILLAFKQLKHRSRISIENRLWFTSLSEINKTNNDLTSNCTNIKGLFGHQDRLASVIAKVHTSSVDSKEIGYSEFQKLQNSINVIDVREKDEIKKTGTIPGSLHIPLKQIDNALAKGANDFKSKYGRRKPGEGETVMFLCQKGGRSRKAMEKAIQLGYRKALSYKGGWEDFDRNNKN